MYQIATPQFRSLLESVSPVVAWDFTLGGYPLPVSVTAYSRTSNAMLTDSSGKITYAGNNQFPYSNAFNQAGQWSLGTASIAQNVTGFDGAANKGWTITAGAGGVTCYVSTVADTIVAPSIFSVYVQAGTAPYAWLQTNDAGGVKATYFNLSNGTVGTTNQTVSGAPTSTQSNATISGPVNGYYRISVLVSGATSTFQLVGFSDADASRSITNGRTGILTSAQLEAVTYQTTPSAYKDTPTSAAYYESPRTLWVNGVASGNLLEGAATNLVQGFGLWTSVASTLTAASANSPDGTNNAYKFAIDATNAQHYTLFNTAIAANGTYTASVYLKASEYSTAEIWLLNAATADRAAVSVNLANGTVGVPVTAGVTPFTSPTARVTAAANGFYRVELTATTTGGAINLQHRVFPNNSSTFSGTAGNGIFVFGPQLEIGVTATSLIPTYSAALTRAADTPSAVSSPLGGNLSFSRASNATIFDATGALTYAPNNLVTYSSNFGSTGWTPAGTANISGQTTGPDSVSPVYAVTANAGNGFYSQGTTLPAGANFIFSAYIKAITAGNIQLAINQVWFGGAGGDRTLVVNGVTGAFVSKSAEITNYSITSAGNGYFRIAAVFTTSSSGAGSVAVYTVGSQTYAAAWIQLEQVTYETTPRAYNATLASAYYGPALDYNSSGVAQGLRIEEARTNSNPNSMTVGGVAGSPGTLPTSVTVATSGITGLTRTLAFGTEYGMPYMDFRVSGTPSAAGFWWLNFSASNGIAAAQGQTWTSSLYSRVVAGSATGMTIRNVTSPRDVTTAALAGAPINISTASTLSRTASPLVGMPVNTAFVMQYIEFGFSGPAVDLTLRIYAPQLEQGSFATSFIPTYGSALTRAADVVQFADGALNTLLGNAASFIVEFTPEGFTGGSAYPTVLGISDNTGGSTSAIELYGDAGTNKLTSLYRYNGAGTQIATLFNVMSAGSMYRGGMAFSKGDHSSSVTSAASLVRTSAPALSAPTTQAYIGWDGNAARMNGWFRGVSIYSSALSDGLLNRKMPVGSPL